MNSSGALWKIALVIPFVIDMMNSVHSLPTNLPTEFMLVKMARHHFFFICFNFFLTVIPSVYTEGIFLSVKSLENLPTEIFPWKFTDENIPSIFPFVFIDFLVVFYA